MKRIAIIITTITLPPVVAFIVWIGVVYPVMWQINTRKDSLRVLASAKSTDELTAAINPLGLFLTFPDGSWMAIRYKDMHSWSNRSMSIALDSGGQWFESPHHFCGMLAGYRSKYELRRLARESGNTEDAEVMRFLSLSAYSGIHAVAESKTLVEARRQLAKMDFTPMKR
jgi:hypothetical protein